MPGISKKSWLRFVVAIAGALQASCAVGPNYTRPKANVPTAFAGNALPRIRARDGRQPRSTYPAVVEIPG